MRQPKLSIGSMVYTKYRDFKTFHTEQAIAFKKRLAEQKAEQSGKS
jgi:hypothetical protein